MIQIKKLLKQGVSCKKISLNFPVSTVSIQNIKNNKSWSHIKI